MLIFGLKNLRTQSLMNIPKLEEIKHSKKRKQLNFDECTTAFKPFSANALIDNITKQ
jgi:hypothetical protein